MQVTKHASWMIHHGFKMQGRLTLFHFFCLHTVLNYFCLGTLLQPSVEPQDIDRLPHAGPTLIFQAIKERIIGAEFEMAVLSKAELEEEMDSNVISV